jgi:hypothetical protein
VTKPDVDLQFSRASSLGAATSWVDVSFLCCTWEYQ